MAAGCLPSMKNKAPSPQEKGFLQPPIGKSEHMLALSTPVGPSNAMLCTNSTWDRKFSMMAPGTWASDNPLPSFHLGSVIFWDELSACSPLQERAFSVIFASLGWAVNDQIHLPASVLFFFHMSGMPCPLSMLEGSGGGGRNKARINSRDCFVLSLFAHS